LKQLIPAAIILAVLIQSTAAQSYVTPVTVTTLPGDVEETSGLLYLDGELWTHNDSGDDAILYQVDPSDGDIIRTVEVVNADNVDWEDITHDDTYIYIGDIGNNEGSRTDLKIYRIEQSDLADNDEVSAEEISFFYSDQTSFEPNYHNTNFDCEALMHYQGNLYVFTKNWLDYKTNCYVVPKTIGDHEATFHSSFDASCLISGATLVPASGAVALIGYTTSGGSYTWVFDAFDGDDFFGGESIKLIWTVLSQIEGVCDSGGNDIYISSEEFSGFLDPTLYSLDLSGFTTGIVEAREPAMLVYGEGTNIVVRSVSRKPLYGELSIYNVLGSLVQALPLNGQSSAQVPMPGMKGVWVVVVEESSRTHVHKIMLP
jgi:hypothetical protein